MSYLKEFLATAKESKRALRPTRRAAYFLLGITIASIATYEAPSAFEFIQSSFSAPRTADGTPVPTKTLSPRSEAKNYAPKVDLSPIPSPEVTPTAMEARLVLKTPTPKMTSPTPSSIFVFPIKTPEANGTIIPIDSGG